MKSLDTNILVYAVNQGSARHEKARQVYEAMLERPAEWIVCDQVLFELRQKHPGLRRLRICCRAQSEVETDERRADHT